VLTAKENKINNAEIAAPAAGAFFKPTIQPKLSINQPNDIYEQEADATADKIMRMPDASADNNLFFKPSIQRKCAHCEEDEKIAQRKERNNNETAVPEQAETYINSLNGKGRSLGHDERDFFEPRFGHDFSNVQLHTGSEANQSAKSINALAYTHGNNIVFGSGQYQPNTESGKKLMAHELTHVVQQKQFPDNQNNGIAFQRLPDIQRNGEPQGETNQYRLIARFLPSARPAVRRILSVLRTLGVPISGVALGVKLSGTAGDTAQVGAGVDSLYFLDIANLELTTDTLAYGELGVGLSLGAGGGIIIGIRLSPNAQYGTMSGAYGGHSFNFALRLIAGVGFSISPGIFSGQEGFLAATISIGAQAGASASYSYAVSGTDAVEAINTRAQQIADGINSGIQTISDGIAIAGGITQAVVSTLVVRPILIARASLMVSNWNLDALPGRTQTNLRVIGGVLNLTGTPDELLAYVSRRLNSLQIQPLLSEMSADIAQALRARGNANDNILAASVTPEYLGNMSVLNFIHTLNEYRLLRFIRPPEVIADELSQPAAAR
jgi:Domain of unknown function (DUF4157)